MSIKELGIQCIKDEAEALLELIPKMDEGFDRAVELMYSCHGKIIVTGVGKSGHVGAKIAATLSSTGTPSFFINPLDVFHGDLGVMTSDDELLRFIPLVLQMEIPIIAMSGHPQSLLAKYATCHLNVSVRHEADPMNLAPTSSAIAEMAMGDALAVALIKKRNFQPQDFAQFHPGGELGRRLLTTAQDVMRTVDMPIISPDMHLGDAIILVSKGKLGLGVAESEGRVVGLITDGDIRRAMEKWRAKFFDRTVADIMTTTPKTVHPQMRISEIQRIMNKYKIHSVLVVDNEHRLLGVVDHYSCEV